MRTPTVTGLILAGCGVDGGSSRRMGLVLICGALGADSLAEALMVGTGAPAFGLAAAGVDLVSSGFAAAAGVGATGVFSLALAVAGAANGFSSIGPGGDESAGFEDGAVDTGASEIGVATTIPSWRSLSFGLSLASSAAGDAGLAGTAGVFSATDEGCDCEAGAGAAGVGASAGGSARNLSLMTGLAMAGADGTGAGEAGGVEDTGTGGLGFTGATEDGMTCGGWAAGVMGTGTAELGTAGGGASGSSGLRGLRGGDSSPIRNQLNNFPTKRNQKEKDSLAV
jgi:hypothetical protein